MRSITASLEGGGGAFTSGPDQKGVWRLSLQTEVDRVRTTSLLGATKLGVDAVQCFFVPLLR